MSNVSAQNLVASVIKEADIAEVIAAHTEVHGTGDRLTACCPFHEDKGRSLIVNKARQMYFCGGCNASGNAIDFLSKFHKMSFAGAAGDLANFLGIAGDIAESLPTQMQEYTPSQKGLIQAQEAAMQFYVDQLNRSPEARTYLSNRGLSDDVIKDMQIGFAPKEWRNLEHIYTGNKDMVHALFDSGLLLKRDHSEDYYDRFRDRIMFPIRNQDGFVVAFGGRVTQPEIEPKYLNSPETGVFSKSKEMYGIFEAANAIKSRGYVIINEGYMDVVALRQFGFENVVATLGTATSELHIRMLLKYTRRIVYNFDGDRAGKKAAWRAFESALEYMSDGTEFSFLLLPDGHDPDSFIRTSGNQAYENLVRTALRPEQYLEQSLKDDVDTLEGRMRTLCQAVDLLKRMPAGEAKTKCMQVCRTLCQVSEEDLVSLEVCSEPGDRYSGEAPSA